MKNKKAQFAEIDFLMAITILAAGLILITAPFIFVKEDIQTDRLSYDAINMLSTMKIQDLEASLKKDVKGNLTEFNLSFSEQDPLTNVITKLLIKYNETQNNDSINFAKYLINETFEEFMPERYQYEVSVLSGDTVFSIISIDDDKKTNIASQSRTLLSGLEVGRPISGFVSSGIISEIKKVDSSYVFFGGFIGQGNISYNINVSSDEIINVYIEGLFDDAFDFFMNGNFCNDFNGGFVSENVDDCVQHVNDGLNNFSILFNGSNFENQYVSGGLLRIDHNVSDQTFLGANEVTERKYISGIDGIINVYDSFHVPGRLKNVSVFLEHDFDIVFNTSSVVDYDAEFDVVLVLDLSQDVLVNDSVTNFTFESNFNIDVDVDCPNVNVPDTGVINNTRLDIIKCSSLEFINRTFTNYSNARIGIVGFGDNVSLLNYVELENVSNASSLKNFVSTVQNQNNSCASCGVAGAGYMLDNLSALNVPRFVVFLTGSDPDTCFENEPLNYSVPPFINGSCVNNAGQHFVNWAENVSAENISFLTAGLNVNDTTINNLVQVSKKNINASTSDVLATGLIRFVDTLLFPDDLEEATLRMTIANQTIYETNESGHKEFSADNVITYPYENTTIPFRIGFDEFSTTIQTGGPVDVVLVTDLSGSMGNTDIPLASNFGDDFTIDVDVVCNINLPTGGGTINNRRRNVAQCLNFEFINRTFHEVDDVRIGMVGYGTTVPSDHYIPLVNSSGFQDLWDYVQTKTLSSLSMTCSSCGVAAASYMLKDNHVEGRQKISVFMTDGAANRCYRNNPDEGYVITSPMTFINSACPSYTGKNNARAHLVDWANHTKDVKNATFYSIAFAIGADWSLIESSSGDDAVSPYFFEAHDGESLSDVYGAISEQIGASAGYVEQVINVSIDEFDVFESSLSSNSYIEYVYEPYYDPSLFGTIRATVEENFNGSSCSQTFNWDFGSGVVPGKGLVTSYSGSIWTSLVKVNNVNVFDIKDYGSNFGELGDPFVVGVPPGLLGASDNEVNISLDDGNTSVDVCNTNNKLIFDAHFPASFSSGGVHGKAVGCKWEVNGELVSIPREYPGTNPCSFNTSTSICVFDDADDSFQVLGCNILKGLTYNAELVIDLEKSDLDVSWRRVDDVPYLWGPALIGVTLWR